jgi:hypothetical protein
VILVPAALPVLDFSWLSGRFFFDSFDALILLTIGILLARLPPGREDFRYGGTMGFLIVMLIVIGIISLVRGFFPMPRLDANAFSNYYSSFNSLRVAKGFAWAVLLLPFLARTIRTTPAAVLYLGYGFTGGLFLASLAVVWERILFPGLLNFTADYRVSGSFWSMHTGGAHIDLFLAATLPFIPLLMLGRRRALGGVIASILLAFGLYAAFVTFSRGLYVAVLASGVVAGVGLWVASREREDSGVRVLAMVVGIAVFAALIAAPFTSKTFLSERFVSAGQDFDTRIRHWTESLKIMDDKTITVLFGMGQGRFPATYFWRNPTGQRSATYRIMNEDGNRYLRLGAGLNLYHTQIVSIRDRRIYTLRFDVRSDSGKGALTLPLCEMWLITSYRCSWNRLEIGHTGGGWKTLEIKIDSGVVGQARGRTLGRFSRRIVRLSLFNGVKGTVIDIDNVRLFELDGRDLVRNGNFSAGYDGWFFTTDDHLPWHTKNILLNAYFDQGLLGVIVLGGLTLLALVRLTRQVMGGERFSALVLAAIVGFLLVGLFASPFDVPRLTVLYLLLVFTGLLLSKPVEK